MSADRPALDAQSFNSKYKILKETADWLSGQKEPDIDQLVPKVETAMQAYQICKNRLNAVKQTLDECLGQDGRQVAGAPDDDSRGATARSSTNELADGHTSVAF